MNGIFGLYGAAAIFVVIGLIAATIFTLIVVGWMAEQRGRSVAGWVLIALFVCTPVLAMACLFCLGETDKQKVKRIAQEEKIRLMTKDRHNSTESIADYSIIGNTVNDLYSEY